MTMHAKHIRVFYEDSYTETKTCFARFRAETGMAAPRDAVVVNTTMQACSVGAEIAKE